MVDNTIALQVKSPEVPDLSTNMLRAYQIRNAQSQNEIGGLQLEAAKQRQSALSDYALRRQQGDPRAPDALAAQPDLQAKVFENMTTERQQRIQAIGDAAKSVYPLRGTPQFKEAWQREMDNLHKSGAIPTETYKQWRDNPSDLVLSQALSMSVGLDSYLKAEGQNTANKVVAALQPMLTGGAPAADGAARAAPQVDAYAANVIVGESGGRNLPQKAAMPGQPVQTAGGIMQFTKGTWDAVAKQNPDLALTPADRFVPAKQIEAEKRLRRDNASVLADGNIVPTDRNLYMAHFLGGQGAKDFLTGMAENPDQPAINLVTPGAAAANKTVFYSPGGQPLTARQVYEKQTARFGNGMSGIEALGQPQAAAVGAATTINDRLATAAPQLASLALTPGMPDDTRKTLLELAKAGIQYGQPTTQERDYISYARAEDAAGRKPLTRLDWTIAQKKPPITNITVEAAGAKEVQQGLAKRYLSAEDAARTAASEIRSYETIDRLLADPNVYTGTAGEQIASLKKLGSTLLGLDLKGVPNAEVARKITDELALTFKKQSNDPQTSNYERQVYERMSVGLNDSAKGRALMLQLRVADARNLQQVAEIWRAHVRKDGSVDPEVFKALAAHDASRREELGGFVDAANEISGATTQPPPTAGANAVIEQLRQKYKELE